MDTLSRENRGVGLQAGIVITAFRQNSPLQALVLAQPVLMRRVKEIAKWCLSPLKFFTPRHRIMRDFIAQKLADPDGSKPSIVGNYSAFASLLTHESVVYAFGVGGDIRFDRALVAATACTVHLFDPTPRSARFMAHYADNPLLRFHPWGVWIADGPMRFFSDVTLVADTGGNVVQDYRSGSIANITGADDWFEAECFTLPSIMQRLRHRHIDLLKMDIEGAALEVMEYLLMTDVRPTQIIVEFEAPREDVGLKRFLDRVERVVDCLKGNGYTLRTSGRRAHHSDSIEFLAVRS